MRSDDRNKCVIASEAKQSLSGIDCFVGRLRRPPRNDTTRVFFLFYFIFFLFLPSALAVEAGDALTLGRAYELALKRSEDIAIKAEVIHEAEAHFYRALSGVLPKVSFVITRQEQEVGSAGETSEFGENASSSALRRTTHQKKFAFSQPLFSGFKEFAALQGVGAEKAQRFFEKKRAEELLFVDVMEAFYAVMEARRDVAIVEMIQKALKERVKELEERARLGRSRDSEVQTAVVDQKTSEYDAQVAKRMEAVARELLEFYIGREISGELVDKGRDRAPQDVSYYAAKANDRFDLKAAKEAHVLAQKNVIVAQSGFFPTARLDGNYYTERVGFQSGIDWDLLFTIDIPLFDGWQTVGEVKEAAALREEARLFAEKTKRLATLDVKNAHQEFASSLLEEKALSGALEASKKSYELQAGEYRMNLVNNLEVLDALRRYQETNRRFNAAHFEARKNFWKLKVAAGEEIVSL